MVGFIRSIRGRQKNEDQSPKHQKNKRTPNLSYTIDGGERRHSYPFTVDGFRGAVLPPDGEGKWGTSSPAQGALKLGHRFPSTFLSYTTKILPDLRPFLQYYREPSIQNPRWTQNPQYISIFTHHLRS